ncbi:type VI secretion system Vgr family protein [sulfur-oxidizing endosymbiont of Gigantopelta aegis]|uniref:type VI secretion system Vgr family protein n=1 Tax=sulfur-oxidizing endosymbiont of Gigantopelta aegis TaxID=2794934 RepID=UPI0018DCEF4A|nr:type VI secretion system tip protein TssI/VgrG [sulfur-oxidizing endosymbiont of Gigantopelta aegis]
MASVSQDPITPGNTQRLTLDISNCIEDTTIFELSGQQTLSAPYELSARFICGIPDLDLSQLVRQAAIITLYYKNESRYYHGIIKDATLLGENGQSYVYEITLVPKVWFLNYRRNCRIFQQKNVQQIITQLLDEAGLSGEEVQFHLKEQYATLNYTVQFNETDFAFISRLLERHGIHYHFVHESDKHILVFADINESLPHIEAADLELRPRNGLEPDYTSFASFQRGARIGHDHATHIGFDLSKPAKDLKHVQRLNDSQFLEHYSFHDHQSFQNAEAGQHYIDQSLQAFKAQTDFGEGKSDVIRAEPGYRFILNNHQRSDYNQKYLIHNVNFKVRQYASLEEYAGDDSGFHYDNTTKFIPDSVRFKPEQITPKPQLDYQDGVFVSGPKGEEIYTDKYGRIKVQFPWDREGQNDENSSCWIPVSQSWAGNQWGKIHIPRIGHEVLVSFINGDPDQPIVVGSLYNAVNRPPYALPKHKTRSTTKTNSSLGGKGFNEIRFEDKKGQEQIAIFAEKDIDSRVKNDRREHINHDRHLIVNNTRFEHIKNNKHLIIDNNQNIEIGGDAHLDVGQTHHIKVGQDYYLEAGTEIHIKAGNKMVFDAGEMLSMKAGGSVMKTSAGGVGFNGATIRINEGGSPGNGSGASPQAPKMPQEADKDYPGYQDKVRKAQAKHVPLRLMEQEVPLEPKPFPPRVFNDELLAPPIAPKVPFYFSAQLRDHNNKILSGIAYELTLDGEMFKGSTNGEGFIEFEIEEKPKELTLSYRPIKANPDYIEYWEGSIDTLESESETKGQQKRLRQQGYYPGALDGQDMGKTSSAWSKFTEHQGKSSRDGQRLNMMCQHFSGQFSKYFFGCFK